MAFNDIIIVKVPDREGPVQQTATLRTSLIQYMCNKCNKKYTTYVGLKRHLKFCTNSESDISLQIPNLIRTHDFGENHNNNSSQNMNNDDVLLIKTNNNPYEFKDEDYYLHRNSLESDKFTLSTSVDENVCECCGENINTAHQVYK